MTSTVVARPLLDPAIVASFRQRRIADAMAQVCVERGYRAATIGLVASRAGVSRATIYAQFENREAILIAILDHALPELHERVEAACRAEVPDTGPDLEAAVAAVLDWVAEEPLDAHVCLVEALCSTPVALSRYSEWIDRFSALLRAATAAELRRPPTFEESQVGGIAWILGRLLRAGEAERAPELLPEISAFLRLPGLAAVAG